MAMTAASLAARVDTAALAAQVGADLLAAYQAAPEGGKPTGADNLQLLLDRLVPAFAAAVVAEVQANALVAGNVVVTSVSAVTVGAGVSGPGTGTLAAGRIS